MSELSASRVVVLVLAGALAAASLALSGTPHEAPPEEGIRLWEAYARGLVSVTMESWTYQRGEDTVTLPVGLRVDNAAERPVVVEEEAVLMSPHPSEPPGPGDVVTTQDAVLTVATIPAGGALMYFYGEEVVRGFLPEPTWWCLEEFQFTQADVPFRLGGETLPFALREVLADPYYGGPGASTQADLWDALRTRPSPVVGKEPLWTTVDTGPGQRIRVDLRATNLALFTYDDDILADVNVTGGLIEDDVPAGWDVEEGSYSVVPDAIVEHGDGSRTLRWIVDLPAAIESSMENPLYPTEYETFVLSYVLVSPDLTAGRVDLPRARSDRDGDGTPDAHSAPVVVDVVSTNAPPAAHAGGPYETVEGETVLLTAAASSDPDGDPLRFRWDLDGDGGFDTDWSPDPELPVRYTDDAAGSVRVEVADGETSSVASADLVVSNAAPEILGLRAFARAGFHLLLAGEKWHDVGLTLTVDGEVLGTGRLLRHPGSPADQALDLGTFDVDLSAQVEATISYTPFDDPVNGRPNGDNPAWLVILLPDGEEVRLGHNFNGVRPATWTWDVRDLSPIVSRAGIRLEGVLRDAGSDDLFVTWDFGDGTSESKAFYNDGNSPDGRGPFGGTSPFEVLAGASHGYEGPGTFRLRLLVRDDDGAEVAETILLHL